jgi:hypothetical protein
MSGAYHDVRIPQDLRRDVLWGSLWRYFFSKIVTPDDCVLDLGAGYASFINTVKAVRRIAIDAWPDFPRHAAVGVETIVAPVTELGTLEDGSIDFAFASNLFEHLTQADFADVLDGLRLKLSDRGSLTILQPNYRHAFAEYFDDYTHISVYSHISLADFLRANGYEVFDIRPRFLPLTIKSRMPVAPWLIGAYLASPVKPLGKQMLLRARPRR